MNNPHAPSTEHNGRADIAHHLCRLTLAVVLCVMCAAPAVAADAGGFTAVFYVTNTNDSGAGSLREAIQSANSTLGDDLISITVGGQLNLESLLPTITGSVTIDAPNPPLSFVIDGQDLYPGLRIDSVPVTINGLVIQNTRTFGNLPGAGIASDGSLVLNSVTIRNCTGGGNGGGASASGTLVVNDGLFEHNLAAQGGGLYAGAALILTNTRLISNTAADGGGAFAAAGAQTNGGRFERNYASNGVGGLAVMGTLTLTSTEFISNTAAGTAGAVFASGSGPFTVSNALFADNGGSVVGGLYASGNITVTLAQTSFTGNYGSTAGAVRANRVDIAGGLFERNTSMSGSGGVSANIVVITNSAFISNTGGNGLNAGGGLGAEQAMISDSWFVNNSGQYGGGVAAWNGALTIVSTVFLGNRASVRGGGLLHGSGDGLVVNSLFSGNTAPGGGAALFLGGSGTEAVKHVTIASSTPVTTSAITTTKEIVLFQNLIIANHAVGLAVGQGFVVVNNALFHDDGQPTAGTIASESHRVIGDPRFVNPAANDFHLLPGSAAIDRGMDAGVGIDFEGDPRPLFMGYDIGYDEAALHALLLPLIRR